MTCGLSHHSTGDLNGLLPLRCCIRPQNARLLADTSRSFDQAAPSRVIPPADQGRCAHGADGQGDRQGSSGLPRRRTRPSTRARARSGSSRLEMQMDGLAKKLGYLVFDFYRGREIDQALRQKYLDDMTRLEDQLLQARAEAAAKREAEAAARAASCPHSHRTRPRSRHQAVAPMPPAGVVGKWPHGRQKSTTSLARNSWRCLRETPNCGTASRPASGCELETPFLYPGRLGPGDRPSRPAPGSARPTHPSQGLSGRCTGTDTCRDHAAPLHPRRGRRR